MPSLNTQVTLTPGKEAVLIGNTIHEQSFNQRNTLSWREGIFNFQNATLKEISRVIPRWYGINVVIDNPDILMRKFTGVVDRNQPIEIFMEDLKAISGIESYMDNKVLHFK